MGNLDLWLKVEQTNPANTKKVAQRGGFTSICAHSQIKAATEVFGPVGIGWGYVVTHSTLIGDTVMLAVADVVLWHGDRSNTFGPWRGMCPIVDPKGRLDDDAGKKSMTDAITKGLSHIGFNADVFLGLFDDNKYVQRMAAEFAPKEPLPTLAGKAWAASLSAVVTGQRTKEQLLSKFTISKEQMNELDAALCQHDPSDSTEGYTNE